MATLQSSEQERHGRVRERQPGSAGVAENSLNRARFDGKGTELAILYSRLSNWQTPIYLLAAT